MQNAAQSLEYINEAIVRLYGIWEILYYGRVKEYGRVKVLVKECRDLIEEFEKSVV